MPTEHIPYSGEEFCSFLERCMVDYEGIPRFRTTVNGFDLPNRFIVNCMYAVTSIPGVMYTGVPQDIMFDVRAKNINKFVNQCNISLGEPIVQSASRIRGE